MHQFNIGWERFRIIFSKPWEIRCWKRIKELLLLLLTGFIWRKWAGKISFDSIREKNKMGITTKGICENNAPRRPSIRSRGIKATIVVMTPKVTGTATSFVPSTAASKWHHQQQYPMPK